MREACPMCPVDNNGCRFQLQVSGVGCRVSESSFPPFRNGRLNTDTPFAPVRWFIFFFLRGDCSLRHEMLDRPIEKRKK